MDNAPVPVEDEETVPVPRGTMAELVYPRCACGCLASRHEDAVGACVYCTGCAMFAPACSHCGTVHIAEDELAPESFDDWARRTP